MGEFAPYFNIVASKKEVAVKSSEIGLKVSSLLSSMKSMPKIAPKVADKAAEKTVKVDAAANNKPKNAAERVDAKVSSLLKSLKSQPGKSAATEGEESKSDKAKDSLSLSKKLKAPTTNTSSGYKQIDTAESAYKHLQSTKQMIIQQRGTAQLAQANTTASSVLNFFIK